MLKRRITYFLFICSFLTINILYATPAKIIIIRHADKLVQPVPGPTLSAKGQMRAINFAFYFLKRFGKPDFIIAANPINEIGKDSSLRELLTVAPLANMLAASQPKKGFPISHSYASDNYEKLAKEVLTNPIYNHSTVLICWNHTKIPQLAKKLGVSQALEKWASNDFDSLYVLTYSSHNNVELRIFNQQYPVANDVTWEDFYHKI